MISKLLKVSYKKAFSREIRESTLNFVLIQENDAFSMMHFFKLIFYFSTDAFLLVVS